jgi:hypothetical protein
MLLGLMGLNLILAAPIKPPSSKKVPRTPRLSPSRPPPANTVMLALHERAQIASREVQG